jgi:hypothetical protein
MNFSAKPHLFLAVYGALSVLVLSEVRASTRGDQGFITTSENQASRKEITVLNFTESWNDKRACMGSNIQGNLSCTPYSGGKFKVKAAIPVADSTGAFDPSQFNGTTPFDIKLGHYAFSGTLGDAAGYAPGSTKAIFTLTGSRCSSKNINDSLSCPTKAYEKIKLRMTPKQVAVSISAITGSDADGNMHENPIDADNYDDSPTGTVTNTIPFQMNLDNLSVISNTLPVTGTVVTKSVTDKSGHQDTLSKVRLKGKLTETDLTVISPPPSPKTIFYDDFSGTSLSSAWTVINRHGEYLQNETECNIPQQVSVANGIATITTEAQDWTCGDFHPDGTVWHMPASWPYITGDIQWSNFNFTYGTVEIRAQFPSSQTHTWPATWLLGANCQTTNPFTGDTGVDSCPDVGSPGYTEIDMTECYNTTSPWCQFHVANPGYGIGNGCDAVYPTADTDWHVYKTVWTASSIKQYMDGALVSTCNQRLGNPMFLIIQTQTGGVSGTPNDARLPTTLNIDYVKVTQP